MPPRAVRACRKKVSDCLQNDKGAEDDKENISSGKSLKTKRINEGSSKFQSVENKIEEENLVSSPPKQNVNVKRGGFWSKKLQDLELQEDVAEKEKCSLYEFDGTEESESYQKKKKKKTRVAKGKKCAPSKHREQVPVFPKVNKRAKKIPESERKVKQIHRKSLFREKLVLGKEREKMADRGKKFTFSTGMSSLGITSTPALNKDNLIGASNFLFLSPISNEEAECKNDIHDQTPLKSRMAVSPKVVSSDKKSLEIQTELKRLSCRRVLRSGKMLNT